MGGLLCTVCNYDSERNTELNVSFASNKYNKRNTAPSITSKNSNGKRIIITDVKPKVINNDLTKQLTKQSTFATDSNLPTIETARSNINNNNSPRDIPKAQTTRLRLEAPFDKTNDPKLKIKSSKNAFKVLVNYTKDQKLDPNDVFYIERLSQQNKTIKVKDIKSLGDHKIKFNNLQHQEDIEKLFKKKMEEMGDINNVIDDLTKETNIKLKN